MMQAQNGLLDTEMEEEVAPEEKDENAVYVHQKNTVALEENQEDKKVTILSPEKIVPIIEPEDLVENKIVTEKYLGLKFCLTFSLFCGDFSYRPSREPLEALSLMEEVMCNISVNGR